MPPAVRKIEGDPAKPAFVFVPGLGMDSAFWAAPSEARVLGGLYPLGRLCGDPCLRTLYHDAADLGHTVVTWGPRRPVGPVAEVVSELGEVVGQTPGARGTGVVLLGHSRGGLAARMAIPGLLRRGFRVRALVTLASPHGGTGMARWASMLAPFASFVDQFIPAGEKRALSSALKRALGFLASPGVRELLPGSELLGSLEGGNPGALYCLSAGGTDPTLWKGRYFSLPGTFEKILPPGALPAEMTEGKGDCLVTDQSAALPFADEHLTFHKNHVRIILDGDARGEVLKRLRSVV
jgi:pimeloyl-ACP methyl ester carboxylesterase